MKSPVGNMSYKEGHGDGCVCYSCLDDADDTIIVSRAEYELLKRSSQKWARSQVVYSGHIVSRSRYECLACDAYADGEENIVHAHDCDVATILDLPREEKP